MTDTLDLAAPAWLETPEPEVYWACWGWEDPSKPVWTELDRLGMGDGWRGVCLTPSDAIAAAQEQPRFTWDGQPPEQITIQGAFDSDPNCPTVVVLARDEHGWFIYKRVDR